MDINLTISLISSFIAIVSVIIAFRSHKANRDLIKYTSNYNLSYQTESMLNDNSNLLELHGIDKKSLKNLNISNIEAVYLIHSFTGGDLYHRLEGKSKVTLTDFRKNLLKNMKVRNAWVYLIKDRFVIEGAFYNAINDFIENEYGSSNK